MSRTETSPEPEPPTGPIPAGDPQAAAWLDAYDRDARLRRRGPNVLRALNRARIVVDFAGESPVPLNEEMAFRAGVADSLLRAIAAALRSVTADACVAMTGTAATEVVRRYEGSAQTLFVSATTHEWDCVTWCLATAYLRRPEPEWLALFAVIKAAVEAHPAGKALRQVSEVYESAHRERRLVETRLRLLEARLRDIDAVTPDSIAEGFAHPFSHEPRDV